MKSVIESAPVTSSKNELVVIKLWEVYLLYHPADIYKTLSENSLDSGPEQDLKLPGRVIFRFASNAWESEIKPLLYHYRIPVSVQSSALSAVKVKGRMPAFRWIVLSRPQLAGWLSQNSTWLSWRSHFFLRLTWDRLLGRNRVGQKNSHAESPIPWLFYLHARMAQD